MRLRYRRKPVTERIIDPETGLSKRKDNRYGDNWKLIRRPVVSEVERELKEYLKKERKRMDRFEVTPEVLEQIETLASRNLTKSQIAYCLDISPQTLDRRCKESELIAQAVDKAIKKGQARGISAVTNRLFQDAMQPGRLGAQAFFLKNIANWRDQAAVEVTGKEGEPLLPRREYTDSERAVRIGSIIAAAMMRAKKGRKAGSKTT